MTSLASLLKAAETKSGKREYLNKGGGEMVDLVASMNSMKSMLPNYDETSSFATRRKPSAGGAMNFHGEMPKAGRSVRKLKIKNLPHQLTNPSLIPYPEILTQKKNIPNKPAHYYDIMGPDFEVPAKFRGKSETLLGNKMQKGKKEIPGLMLTKFELENRKKLMQSSGGISDATLGAKKTEATINALNKKISSQKFLWENEHFRWDGYHYRPGKGSISHNLNKGGVKEKAPRNRILEEMSKKFRDSLGINTDMSLAIKSPATSDHALFPSSEGASNPQSKQRYNESPQRSPLGTSSASSEEALSYRGNPVKKPGKGGTLHHTPSKSRNKPKGTSSDIIKLKTLLLGSSSGESSPRSNPNNSSDASKTISYDQLKQVAKKLGQSPRRKTSGSGAISKDSLSSPRKTVDKSHAIVLTENFHEDSGGETVSGRGGDPRRVQRLVKQRLGESVKSVDEAAMVATRLGTLLTKLNMAKGSDNSRARAMKDTVDLAKELRHLAAEMEKEYTSVGSDHHKSGETQTEKSKELMPQIKFTKDMSYTDQLVLRKLREIREERTKLEAATGTASPISPKRKDG